MSLDQIIQQRKDQAKAERQQHKNDQKNKKTEVVKASKPVKKVMGGKFSRPGSAGTGGAEKGLKVVTLHKPKVINPTPSVFARLGSTGTYVLFKNLKSSVEQNDVSELCAAVGEVKEVQLIRDFHGIGTARVLFATSKAANDCVSKYHGITLDGSEMHVELDTTEASQKVLFTTAKATTTAKQTYKPPSDENNKRAGLFGTALEEEPDHSHRKVNPVQKARVVVTHQDNPRQHHNNNNNNNHNGNNNNNHHKNDKRDNFARNNKKHDKKPFPKKRAEKGGNFSAEDLDNELDTYMSSR